MQIDWTKHESWRFMNRFSMKCHEERFEKRCTKLNILNSLNVYTESEKSREQRTFIHSRPADIRV